jgi:rhomboid protease GluP
LFLVECPNCRTVVVPNGNGTCPSCRRAIVAAADRQQPPATVQPSVAEPGAAEPAVVDAAITEFAVPAANRWGDPAEPEMVLGQRIFDDDAQAFFRRQRALTPHIYVTAAIVAINVAVFLAMTVTGVSAFAPEVPELLAWGANFGPRTLDGEAWRLVTSTFVHIGFLHVALNMAVLWKVGRILELMVGNVCFLAVYAAGGLGGAIASVVWQPWATSAGASGAVFGLLGAVLVFAMLHRNEMPTSIRRQLTSYGVGFFVLNVPFGLFVPHIDHAAHLGGFLGGALAGLLVARPFDGDVRARRAAQGLATIVLTVALAGTYVALATPPPDIFAILASSEIPERECMARHNEVFEANHAGKISDEEFARAIHEEVLPRWHAMRVEYEKLQGVDAPEHVDPVRLDRVLEYFQLREKSWQQLVEALRESDAKLREEKSTRHNASWQRAEEMLGELAGR